jgi:uncharacterized phiE125 gp8 family phage protein
MSTLLVPGQTLTEPVTLAALKLRLHLTATSDDASLTGILTQAREFAERVSRRALAYASYVTTMDRFPYPHEPIRVSMPPLISLTSITFYDDTLTLQTLDPSEYWTAPAQIPALIVPTPGNVWPCAGRVPGSVSLSFNAGYGYPGAPANGNTPATPPGPSLPTSWANNIMDIGVFIYENAGAPIPENLVQIPKVFVF